MDKSLFVEIEGLEVISGDAVLGSEVVPAGHFFSFGMREPVAGVAVAVHTFGIDQVTQFGRHGSPFWTFTV